MQHVGEAKRFDHVGADAVGAERHRVAEAHRVGVTHRVVHVGPGIVEDGSRQLVVGGQMDAVGQQPSLLGEARQPLRGIDVLGSLGDVDVDTHSQIVGQPGGSRQRLLRAGERGVNADQAPTSLLQKSLVLGQAPLGALWAVAVGDPVGTQRPNAHLGAGLGDDGQRPLDGAGRLVVVDDGGGARLQGLHGAEHRRPAQHLQVEGGVEPPPDLLQDLLEARGGLRGRRHSPGQL